MLALFSDGSPLSVDLTQETARLRQPTHSNTPARVSLLPSTGSGIIPHEQFQPDHYRNRARERDGKCLITGRRSATWSRLKTAHIFPRAHVDEVSSKQSYDRQLDLFPSSVGQKRVSQSHYWYCARIISWWFLESGLYSKCVHVVKWPTWYVG